MNNFQKANELLTSKGYDLKNDYVDDLTDLIDDYFLTRPDSKLFQNSDTEDGCDSWRTYLVCIIEDVYNQINGYEIDQPTTDRELADLTKFIKYGM
tara:strand:- start:5206 stop:5493 length:288 start_codon:yes stop_codon:yes gene_type:complete